MLFASKVRKREIFSSKWGHALAATQGGVEFVSRISPVPAELAMVIGAKSAEAPTKMAHASSTPTDRKFRDFYICDGLTV